MSPFAPRKSRAVNFKFLLRPARPNQNCMNPPRFPRRLTALFLLGSLALHAPLVHAADATAPAVRPSPNTHGVDMRTQSGPPGAARYSPPAPLDEKLPTLWLIGDSTVRNGSAGDGTNLNQWGWGAPLTFFFDAKKVNVVNRALGGTSARSFYHGNWKKMSDLLKAGDVVIMQFGTNDGGNPTSSVGELRGLGDETQDITNRAGAAETVHTFGWYLRQIITETHAKGATPVVCSLIPRKNWDDSNHIARARDTFAGWAGQVARAEQAAFIDLLYVPNPTPEKPKGETVHPGWDGAVLNAEVVVSGLKALGDKNPVAAYFSLKAETIAAATSD